jgi:uncharacterized protein
MHEMRLALLAIAIVALIVLIRLLARRGTQRPAPSAPPKPGPQPMLACAHCGLHLPRDEALPGRGGVFCDETHRAAFERSHPAP